MPLGPLAVYTTMYPGGEPFWSDFLRSVAAQGDDDFVLWIGIDSVEPDAVETLVRRHTDVPHQLWPGTGTPTAVRTGALREITERHHAVVLVDSDDALLPSRVAAARNAMQAADVAGCAAELMDRAGARLPGTFGVPVPGNPADRLCHMNMFGFTNTAYRSSALRQCMVDDDGIEPLDWFLATRAWLFGARMDFDPVARMRYRQYGGNTAGVLGPFTADRIRADLPRVLRHYDGVLSSDLGGALPARRESIEEARAELVAYWRTAQNEPDVLERHARSLSFKDRVPLWWEWVTAPLLLERNPNDTCHADHPDRTTHHR